MKTMKKLLVLGLALVLILALAGCGSKKSELVGTWEGNLDMSRALAASVDEEVDFSDFGDLEPVSFGDYLGDCALKLQFVFKDDGTYTESVDEASVNQVKQVMREATLAYYIYVMEGALAEGLRQGGLTGDFNDRAVLEQTLQQYLGMSLEEAVNSALGMDMESYVDSILSEDMWQEMLDSYQGEGKYKTDSGKLYLSAGLEYNVDPEVYDEYTLSGNTLTLTANHGGDEEDMAYADLIYPVTFQKVG